MTTAGASIPPRAAPRRRLSAATWLRANLFATTGNAVATVVLGAILLWAACRFFDWGFVHAVWAPDAQRCQTARGTGACWGVIAEKGRFILLGRYPAGEAWRPAAATALAGVLIAVSSVRRMWAPWLAAAWVIVLGAIVWLMGGGFGLARIPTDLWGGLPLTVLLALSAVLMSFPLAIAVALGKRSRLPAVRALCTTYVELIRGVPLISVLFMASFMFPLLMPQGRTPDVLLRVIVGITLFEAAYMAEIVRAGLQSVPRGQLEAAASLGLRWWPTQRRVVLPQALAAVVPAVLNNFISLFKDTSLVTIVSLYELTGALSLAVDSDPDWRPFKLEGYLFIAAIYFACCFAMARQGLRIEHQLGAQRGR